MFSTITHITWTLSGQDSLTPEQRAVLREKSDEMTVEEKTDGSFKIETVNDTQIVTRHWINLSAAEEWVNFLQPFKPLHVDIES